MFMQKFKQAARSMVPMIPAMAFISAYQQSHKVVDAIVAGAIFAVPMALISVIRNRINKVSPSEPVDTVSLPNIEPSHEIEAPLLSSEDKLYEEALIEIETGNIVKSLWARAMAEAGGDEARTKALYIRHRVENFRLQKPPSHIPSEPHIEQQRVVNPSSSVSEEKIASNSSSTQTEVPESACKKINDEESYGRFIKGLLLIITFLLLVPVIIGVLGRRNEGSDDHSNSGKYVASAPVNAGDTNVNPHSPPAQLQQANGKDAPTDVHSQLIGGGSSKKLFNGSAWETTDIFSYPEFSAEGLGGVWTRVGYENGTLGKLTIRDVASNTFAFSLSALYGINRDIGPNIGEIEGIALREGNAAVFKEQEYGCEMRFRRKNDRLLVSHSQECNSFGGLNVTFWGEYAKDVEPAPSAAGVAPSQTSINCTRAANPAEIAICTDADLMALDKKLTEAYSRVRDRLSASQFAEVRRSQIQWIGDRNHKCRGSVPCLKQEIDMRTSELNRIFP
jgi:uncharacterized protein YecT (DUF1311 family)